MKSTNYYNINKEKKFFKKTKTKYNKYENNNKFKLFNNNTSKFFFIILLLIIIIQFIIINNKSKYKRVKYDINFKYEEYDKDIIPDKENKISKRLTELEEIQYINGIIRKNKLKTCLEIGVGYGGSSIVILNALKDIKNSVLVSIDLYTEIEPGKTMGYKVYENFPELAKNWKLYTGEQPHKILVNLNMKFDFVLLDSAHLSPGEIINFIEVLPFLKENAIVIVHDIFYHFWHDSKTKFYPSCISLIPAIYGDKVLIYRKVGGVSNMGAVFLYSNQEEHYLDYFLLLLNFWEYIPSDEQTNDLRRFIKQYYKDNEYINIFNIAVRENIAAYQKFQNNINKWPDRN